MGNPPLFLFLFLFLARAKKRSSEEISFMAGDLRVFAQPTSWPVVASPCDKEASLVHMLTTQQRQSMEGLAGMCGCACDFSSRGEGGGFSLFWGSH